MSQPIRGWRRRCIDQAGPGRRVLWALSLWLWGLACAFASGPEAADVAVDVRNGVYFASLAVEVDVSQERARQVLTDFDHMASFMPGLESSKLLSQQGNVYRIAQRGRSGFGPFSVRLDSERRIEWFPEGRLVSEMLSGAARSMHSELRLVALGRHRTRIDYRLEVQPIDWWPSGLVASFLRSELAEQFSALVREMMRREQAAANH